MTAHRRPLLLFTAVSTFFLPACLFVTGPSSTTQSDTIEKVADAGKPSEPPRKILFAELRPGTRIAANNANNAKDAKDGKDGKDTATAQRQPGNSETDPGSPWTPGTGDVKVAQYPSALPVLQPSPIPEPPLLAAVRAYTENHADKAIEILKALDPPNQEFVLAMLPALARGANGDLADPTVAGVLADQLRSVLRQLESRASLQVENVAFCRKVYFFGRYDLWPEGQPYHPNDVAQLYLEVRNLVSQPAVGPHGETHLTHVRLSVEVFDARGARVPQADPDDWRRRVEVAKSERTLFTRGPVEEFHIIHPFPVPSTPGVYTIVVEVRDPTGRRSVKTAPVRFDVAGP